MADKTEINRLAEPKSQKGDRLPEIQVVREYTEYWLKKTSGLYDVYKAINGKWILINQDVG